MFMYKPAPISLSWWTGTGYTTGLSSIDYFLADPTLVPEGSEHLFAEEVWKMDYPCSLVYRPDPTMGPVNPLPALTNGFITFGSLTRSIRLNDRVINTWSNILKQVPNSKMIIDSNGFQHDEARFFFIKKFEKRR
jgi:predicted O-linked N-acetylglucosamine transferase (SPINDLY family)